jgi:cellulose synthase (UDP-forming)
MTDTPAQGSTRRVPLVAAALLAVPLVYAGGVQLSDENQMLVSAGALCFLFLAGAVQGRHPDSGRMLVILAGAFLSLRYWLFRTTQTLGYGGAWDLAFMALLYVAETYGILAHFMGLFVNLAPLKRTVPPLPKDPSRLPTVDVFVPTYEEPAEIVYVTLTACTQMDYPREKLNIFLLDDGGTDQKLNSPEPGPRAAARSRSARLRSIARELGVTYIARSDNSNAKAGNINHGLRSCGCGFAAEGEAPNKSVCVNIGLAASCGELVLVLDCDHVPTRDFLRCTVGFFLADERLFLVQTPHFFINPTPVEKNLELYRFSPGENEMFYGAVHPGLDFWNASFFCGSAALLRRRHLMEIGGISGETVTEDAETALRLHAKGYRSVYLNKPMAIGLSPETFEDFIVQRSRWAQGMLQILLLKNPLRQPGLKLSQRLCYLNACLFWMFGLARVVFFISPLLFLIAGLKVYNASLFQVLIYALPHLMASYFVANRLYGERRHPFFSELYETVQSLFLAPALLSVFANPRRPAFRVTPKGAGPKRDRLSPLAFAFYAMLLPALAAFPLGLAHFAADPLLLDSLVLCLAWNSFNVLLVLGCLGVVCERRQLRRSHRYTTREPVALRRESGDYVSATLTNLSTTGVSLALRGMSAFPDDRLQMEAADGEGRTFVLPLRVRRRDPSPEGLRLGCEFEEDTKRMPEIIGFVYGDSRRWKYFSETGRLGAVGSMRAFRRLLRVGAAGAARHMGAISLFFLDFLDNYGVLMLSYLRKGKERETRHENPQSCRSSGIASELAAGTRAGGEHENPPAEAGGGSGLPAARDDGQLQCVHPHPETLESEPSDPSLRLR